MTSEHAARTDAEVDVLVVGAGFAGMYMIHKARSMGLTVHAIEAGGDVGGTWYWNRYPGARCDVESLDYSYGFSPELLEEWTWSERFAAQPEILRYIDHVADRFDLRSDIEFDTRVTSAHFDDATDRWAVGTDTGSTWTARFCVMATGCLSLSYVPPFAGLDRFEGRSLHTGRWPHEPVDFTGQRVGVIGTGSSGIQVIPEIARQAGELFVFQRTPNFTLPARNGPVSEALLAERMADYAGYKRTALTTTPSAIGIQHPPLGDAASAAEPDEREAEFERRWDIGGNILLGAYRDVLLDADSNELVGEFVRRKIRSIVHDPDVAALLSPTDHHIGTKRICVDTDYYETFNRPNVRLVDVRSDPIEGFSETALVTAGHRYDLDVVVFATGYDAMTGPLMNIDVRGRGGVRIAETWEHGPATYLGLGVHGYPNLFIVAGPGSPSVRVNVIAAIEQHVDWIGDCIAHLEAQGIATIEPTAEAQDGWVRHVADLADATLFGGSSSWYSGSNIDGKPRVFAPYVGGMPAYIAECDAVVAAGYAGFTAAGDTAKVPAGTPR